MSRPIGVGEQAEEGQPFSKPGRYYLKVGFEDSSEKALYNLTGGKPYDAELAVEVLGRSGKAAGEGARAEGDACAGLIRPERAAERGILTLVGGGLAAAGFAGAAVFTFRRRRP